MDGENKKQLAAQLDELDRKIAAEERALQECYTQHVPAEVPPVEQTVARAKDGSIIPNEKLKETYYPPVPEPPPTITVPPPPAAESAYVDALTALAGDSPMLAELAEDLRALLEMRREAAARYLVADEGVRPFLASAIYSLSQRITETVDGIPNEVSIAG